MRTVFCFVLCFLLGASVFSQDYIDIESYEASNGIVLSKLADFKNIISEYKIKKIYVYQKEREPYYTSFIIIADSIQYKLYSLGFLTIDDYKEGTDKGFITGFDYYEAGRYGVKKSEIYYYYKRGKYESLKDAEDSYSSGFIFSKYPFETVVLPASIDQSNLELLRKQYPLMRDTDNYDKRYKDGTAISLQSTIIPIRSFVKDPLKDPIDQFTESQLFYLARMSGYGSMDEYKNAHIARTNGYFLYTDYMIAMKKGFKYGNEYYIAKENGFESYKDFKNAERMAIKSFAEYNKYITVIEESEEIKAEEGISIQDAVIHYFLRELPSGSMLSLEKLREYFTKKINELPGLVKLYGNFRMIDLTNPSEMEKLMMLDSIKEYGSYEKATGIFRKK